MWTFSTSPPCGSSILATLASSMLLRYKLCSFLPQGLDTSSSLCLECPFPRASIIRVSAICALLTTPSDVDVFLPLSHSLPPFSVFCFTFCPHPYHIKLKI